MTDTGPPAAPGAEERPPDARPSATLPIAQLLQISFFWFSLNAIWGGFEIFQQKRVVQLLGDGAPIALGAMEILAMPIAALTMPVAGSISDYTRSRWGRRRPFILFGALTSAAAIAGLGLSPNYAVLVLFFILLQFMANIARGPFAGLVPDVVPEHQVGIASGLMGLMIQLGLVGGYLLVWSGYFLGEDFTLPMIALAIVVAATGIGTFLWAPHGPAPKPRGARTWRAIALETFGTDILKERSYIFLLGSRFFILMAGGFFANLNILFIERTFGITGGDQARVVFIALALFTAATAVGTIPGAKISDRIGRKPIIYASTVLGALGMAIIGLAPTIEIALAGLLPVGVGFGAFLAVDWALMTEIIPKASAGRYMGISNIVEATNGAIATTIGGAIMFLVGISVSIDVGARASMLTAVLMFGIGALLLTPVREPPRTRTVAPAPTPTAA